VGSHFIKITLLILTYLLEIFIFEEQNVGVITTFPEVEDMRPERCKAHCSHETRKAGNIINYMHQTSKNCY
jgi:hypothetical protein